MSPSPTALPIARLRAAGARVGTLLGHDPTAPRAFRRWSYAVTLSSGAEVRVGGHDVADVAAWLTKLADSLAPTATPTPATPTGPTPDQLHRAGWALPADMSGEHEAVARYLHQLAGPWRPASPIDPADPTEQGDVTTPTGSGDPADEACMTGTCDCPPMPDGYDQHA